MAETPYTQTPATNSISLLTILKVINSPDNKEFFTRFTNVNELLSEHITPSFDHITGSPYTNEEISDILTLVTSQLATQKKEILYLHRLLALLIFELLEQGIEFEHKELYNEIKQYLNYK